MLQKKVAELQNIDDLWKKKDPEKLVEGLIKIINLMRDLMKMAAEHSIEAKLYHGDAIDTIHSLMGQSRFRRWLSIVCDDISEGEQHWDRLVKFLEKEVKISQQEMIWASKTQQKPPQSPQPPRNVKKKPDGAHIADGGNILCSICGADDHVHTPGPAGTKLVQYFVCQKFVEMSCKERFTTLKNKNLCHQCLYPGADCTKGKHKEGKCQRDFTCKHPSHDRFSRKKHVLVCDEHKHLVENKTLLDDYKSRFILRDNQSGVLPSYSKGIVIHHTYASSSGESFDDVEPLLGSHVDGEFEKPEFARARNPLSIDDRR